MKTEKIYELLVEASKDETSNFRKNEIQCILGKETAGFNGKHYDINGNGSSITLVFDTLYTETLINNSKFLPTLLPVFNMLCGDRDKQYLVADIDWNFIKNNMNNETSYYKSLSERINKFLDKYAVVNPNWNDDTDNLFTSPDASQMKYCADMLSKNIKPSQCFSEWGSGGYKPYSSKEGREEHDVLIKEIYKIINNK